MLKKIRMLSHMIFLTYMISLVPIPATAVFAAGAGGYNTYRGQSFETYEEIGSLEKTLIEDGYFKLLLKENDNVSEAVLSGMKLHLMDVSKQYPQFISIIFGGVKNA